MKSVLSPIKNLIRRKHFLRRLMPGIRLKLSVLTGIFVTVILFTATAFNYVYQQKLMEKEYNTETENSLRVINSVISDMENISSQLILIEDMRIRIKEKKQDLSKYKAVYYRKDESAMNSFRSLGKLFGVKVKYSYHPVAYDTYFSRYLADKDIESLEESVKERLKRKNGDDVSAAAFKIIQYRASRAAAASKNAQEIELSADPLRDKISALGDPSSLSKENMGKYSKMKTELALWEKRISSARKRKAYAERILRASLRPYYKDEFKRIEELGISSGVVRIISSDKIGETTLDTGPDLPDGGVRFSDLLSSEKYKAERDEFFATASSRPVYGIVPDSQYLINNKSYLVRYLGVNKNPATFARGGIVLKEFDSAFSSWKKLLKEDNRICALIAPITVQMKKRMEELRDSKTPPGNDQAFVSLYSKYKSLINERSALFLKYNPYADVQSRRSAEINDEIKRIKEELNQISSLSKSASVSKDDDVSEKESLLQKAEDLRVAEDKLKAELIKIKNDYSTMPGVVAYEALRTFRDSALYDYFTLRQGRSSDEFREYLRDPLFRYSSLKRYEALRAWIYGGMSETDLPEFADGSNRIKMIEDGIAAFSRSEAEEYMWKLDSTPFVSEIGFFGYKNDTPGIVQDVISAGVTGYNTVIIDGTDGMLKIKENGRNMLIGAGILAFAAVMFTFMFSGFIVRRIKGIVSQAEVAAKGDLTAVFPEKGMDEIEDMAVSLNEMMKGLRDREEMRGELSAAGEIQKQLLPASVPPTLGEHYSIAHFYRSMKGVGGDYYDLIELDENRLLFCMADVSSHGVGPALVMSTVRAHLHGIIKRGERDVVKILAELNKQLFAETPETIFVTFFLGIIDLRTHEIEYSSAGHLEPVLFSHKTKSVARLEAGGLPLGMDDNDFFLETVTLRKIKLKPGDIFFEYTDGVSEAMNPVRELFGDERLHEALIKSSSKKIDVMIRNIASAVQEFTGIDFISGNGSAEINDDIAMLALKRMK